MSNTFKYKKCAGLVTMAACWCIGFLSLTDVNKALKVSIAPKMSRADVEYSVQESLAMPVQADIVGTDLMLFEPIPEKTFKKVKKKAK